MALTKVSYSMINGASVNVLDFGATGNGSTDDTAAIQAAVVYAETIGAAVFFPAGDYDIKMIFIATGGIKLIGQGCTITQNHDATNSITVGGAGQYKVSAAFFIKKGAADIDISGFHFTTDDASFPALAATFGSYFPSIGGQRADRINIYNNRFSGGQDRALFFQGGSNLRFVENDLENNGITLHVGFTDNIYFYDASSNTTDKYSPNQSYLVGNVFDGYTSADPATCLHMTGTINFTVNDNKFVGNLNNALSDVISLYCNDNGPYSSTGVALAEITGSCCNNIIGTGTSQVFKNGISVSGYTDVGNATWNTSYIMNIEVTGNTIRGSGVGIYVERAAETKIHHNSVKTIGSVLSLNREIVDVEISYNTLTGLGAGTNLTTIYSPANLAAINLSLNWNKITTQNADQYAFRTTTAISGLELIGNDWYFNSDVAASRTIVVTLTGICTISDNRFYWDSDVGNSTALVISGSSFTGVLNFSNNGTSLLAGTGAASFRAANFSDFLELNIVNNNMNGAYLIEDATYTYFTNNKLILGASNTLVSADFDNTGRAVKAYVWATGNYIEMPAALNSAGLRVVSNNDATNNTLSKVTMNVVVGNSSGTLIQQANNGVIETIGNTIVNNGAGGTSIGVSGSATNTAL